MQVSNSHSSVFICYSRKDSDFVDQLTLDLQARGIRTWRDVDDIASDLQANLQGWRASVEQALNSCAAMIVVLSLESTSSSEVEAEWNYFASRKRPIFPVLARDCQIPFFLARLQVWDLRKNYTRQIESLASAVHQGLSPSARSMVVTRTVPSRRPKSSVIGWVSGMVAGLIIIAALLARGFGIFPQNTPAPSTSGPAEEDASDYLLPADPNEVDASDYPLPSDFGNPAIPEQTNSLTVTPVVISPDLENVDLSSIGRELWRLALPGQIKSAPVLGPNGTIYVVTHSGMLLSISPDGREYWRAVLGGASVWGHSLPVLGPQGRLYIVYDGELMAFESDGTLAWTFFKSGAGSLTARPAVDVDGTVYLMTNNSNLVAVSPEGDERWSQELCQVYGGGTWPGPVVGSDGIVYGVCHGEDIYALDAETGTILWSYHTNDRMESSPVAGEDELVYFVSTGGWVYAMQPDGHPRWQTSVAGPQGYIQMVDAPLVRGPDGYIYAAPRHGSIYALDPVNGEIIWSAAVGGQGIGMNPVTVSAGGSVYARNLSGTLFGISPTGEMRWQVEPEGEAFSFSPPACSSEGQLYLGVGDELVAFQIGEE